MEGYSTRSLIVGAVWMVGASLLTAILVVLVKFATPSVPTVEILWFQKTVSWLIVASIVFRKGIEGLKSAKPYWQLTCGLAGTIGFFLYFLSLRWVPLINVVLATNTSPLWTPILAWVLLRYRLKKIAWIGIALGFAGVVVILHPWVSGFHPAIVLPLITGFMIGIIFISMQVLGKVDSPYLILFYYSLITAVATLPFAIAGGVMPTGWVWAILIGTGLVALMQMARVWAFQRGPSAILGPLYFLTVPFSGVLDWVFWDHVPNWLFYIGAILIVGGGTWTIKAGRKSART